VAAPSSVVAHHRARVGALSRDRKPDDPELIAARRSLAAAGLAEHAQRVVSGWPALTEEQLACVVAILDASRHGAA
jgi:hypothetical protein